jgi:hypothetical protein
MMAALPHGYDPNDWTAESLWPVRGTRPRPWVFYVGCAGKERFTNRQDAQRAARSMNTRRKAGARKKAPVMVYACQNPGCKGFHVGTDRFNERNRRLRRNQMAQEEE